MGSKRKSRLGIALTKPRRSVHKPEKADILAWAQQEDIQRAILASMRMADRQHLANGSGERSHHHVDTDASCSKNPTSSNVTRTRFTASRPKPSSGARKPRGVKNSIRNRLRSSLNGISERPRSSSHGASVSALGAEVSTSSAKPKTNQRLADSASENSRRLRSRLSSSTVSHKIELDGTGTTMGSETLETPTPSKKRKKNDAQSSSSSNGEPPVKTKRERQLNGVRQSSSSPTKENRKIPMVRLPKMQMQPTVDKKSSENGAHELDNDAPLVDDFVNWLVLKNFPGIELPEELEKFEHMEFQPRSDVEVKKSKKISRRTMKGEAGTSRRRVIGAGSRPPTKKVVKKDAKAIKVDRAKKLVAKAQAMKRSKKISVPSKCSPKRRAGNPAKSVVRRKLKKDNVKRSPKNSESSRRRVTASNPASNASKSRTVQLQAIKRRKAISREGSQISSSKPKNRSGMKLRGNRGV